MKILYSLFGMIVFSVVAFAQAPKANFTADPVVGCAPLEASFSDASSDDVFLWQWDFNNDGIAESNDPFPSHIFTTPGYYSVRLMVFNLTDSNALIKRNYIRVTTPVVFAVGNQTVCLEDSIQLTANIQGGVKPYKYFWESMGTIPFASSDPSPRIAAEETATWRLTVTDSVGCESSRDFIITVKPSVKPTFIRNGSVLTSSAGVSYQWYLNGVAIAGATQLTYTMKQTEKGFYKVRVLDNQGCRIFSDSLNLDPSSVVWEQPEGWMIYPNPVQHQLTVYSANLQQDATIRITDALGVEVLSAQANMLTNRNVLDVSMLSSGVYMVQILEPNRTQVYKLIKE